MKIKELAVKNIKNIMTDRALIIVLVFMIIGTIIIEPSFLQIRILTDILTQSTVKMICTLGLMFTPLLDGINLSGDHQVGLAVVVVMSLSQTTGYPNEFWPDLPELPIIIPVIMTLALVAVIGAVNGFMITKLKVAPFIATLGMSITVYGINCLCFVKKPNNSQPIGSIKDTLTVLNSFKIFGQVSFLVVIAIITVAGVWFLLNKTVFGRGIYVVGSNSEATKVSGINAGKVIIAVFVIESMFAGLAGILKTARTGGANSVYGNTYEFGAISPCVMGDVSLSREVGKISNVIIGVPIFTFISYGLTYIGVNPNWQPIVEGLIVCSAVTLDTGKNS